MTYPTHLKAATTAEVWKATGRGMTTPGVVKFKRICKLMRYLERANKRKPAPDLTRAEMDGFVDAAIDVVAAHYLVPRNMLIGQTKECPQ